MEEEKTLIHTVLVIRIDGHKHSIILGYISKGAPVQN